MFKQIFSFIFIVGVIGSFFAFNVFAEEKGVNIFQEPRRLPTSSIIDEDGKAHKLSDFKDEFVVAIFWERNCLPCIRQLKSLNGFYHGIQGKNIRLLLISSENDWKDTFEQKKFLERMGAKDVPFYIDRNAQVAADLGIFTSPHTVLINAKGEEIGRIRGSAKWDDPRVIKYIEELKEKYAF